jgi:RNA polymerase sigma-70 factor (ECF subfamily)
LTLGASFNTILAAAQDGADWGFARLYDEYNPRLARYFWAKAPRFADDLTADVWMATAQDLGTFNGTEKELRSWLFATAHRVLVEHLGRARRSTEDVVGWDAFRSEAGSDDPEREAIEHAAAHDAIHRISEILNPDQVEVVLLRLFGGLDVAEVAAILGKRPGSVRVLQHRALRRLIREVSLEDLKR